jgi:dTDP-L-rhamnose 4-epimerase
VLVTGGAGFIGGHISHVLRELGYQVVIIDNRSRPFDDTSAPLLDDVEYVWADLCNIDAVRRALDGVDVVLHQAARVGVGESMFQIRRYIDSNVSGTATLLEAIAEKRDQIRQLVMASSMSAYGEGAYVCASCGPVRPKLRDPGRLSLGMWEPVCALCGDEPSPLAIPETAELQPQSVYGASKRSQEELCVVMGEAHGINTTCFRYFGVYGRGQLTTNPYTGVVAMFAARLSNDRAPLIFEDGEQLRDLIHVSDVCRAVVSVVETPVESGVFNLGSGNPVRVSDIARILAATLAPGIEPEISLLYRKGDIRTCIPDMSTTRKQIGFLPEVELKDGLEDFALWIQENRPTESVDIMRSELRSRNLLI